MLKIGIPEMEILYECKTKELTRVNSETNYTDLQVRNEDIWGTLAEIVSIVIQIHWLVVDYMLSTLYVKICLKTYQKPTSPGNNPTYPPGSTQAACNGIKDAWGGDQIEFIAHNNFQHAIKKQIIVAVSPEFI